VVTRLTPRQQEALELVQAKPGTRTDDLARALGWEVRDLRGVLLSLHRRKLVGRQEPLLPHELYSTWWPEMEGT